MLPHLHGKYWGVLKGKNLGDGFVQCVSIAFFFFNCFLLKYKVCLFHGPTFANRIPFQSVFHDCTMLVFISSKLTCFQDIEIVIFVLGVSLTAGGVLFLWILQFPPIVLFSFVTYLRNLYIYSFWSF